MRKKAMPALAAIVLIVVVAAIGLISKVVERYTPSKEVMSPQEYFDVQEGGELALIVQDQQIEQKGILDGGIPYLSYEAVKEYLNDRFYWDSDANLMVYTLPEDIINVQAGESSYTLSGSSRDAGYPIVKVDGSETYIAAAFVQQYTNMDYTLYEEPDRLVINNRWGETSFADLKKEEEIRYQGGIKSPILTHGEKGTKLLLLEQLEDWSRVQTADGYIGYVRNTRLGDSYKETLSREFEEPVYTSIKRDHKINLVWHQVTSMEANDSLLNDIAGAKGVNVISPTWFSVINNQGEISSLASETYVENAHAQGLEVWALVDNLNEAVDTTALLKSTASREKLANQLVAAAVQYSLDGINIDFEALPEEAGDGYIQFIREISVKCRKNGIVLSVDDPVPMPFTAHYDRAEQGIVADYVIIMGYDEHYAGSEEAGSVASLSFEKQGIEDTLKEVPAEKIISAVPFYTRLWYTDAQGKVSSEAIGMSRAEEWLSTYGVSSNWSQETSQDYAELTDEQGGKYQIWLENEKSLEEKAKLVKEYGLGGIAAWKLGLEKPSIWDVIYKYVS